MTSTVTKQANSDEAPRSHRQKMSAEALDLSKVSNGVSAIEGLAIDAREQLGIVLLDLFDREHATADGALVLYEPLSPESVAALRQTVSAVSAILLEARPLLRLLGREPDLTSKFAAPSFSGEARQ